MNLTIDQAMTTVHLSAERMAAVMAFQDGECSGMWPFLGLAGLRVTLTSRCFVYLTWPTGLRQLVDDANHADLAHGGRPTRKKAC
ncbi:hypothetical protein H310_15415 [Aphanomyces invadans]|uniref:Uncharacterized protein n=1 Tax=Aphanomyces invadans TaxID=157072 RepID=A0A024T843_9STRA|nr:hypothetical protein H310_15415 [Aphanomyces invadans]ETV89756.1 hypothetical protein H310_15415 [Aphanomyces invadans]|eukprot:XP_008881612.1 hypothetical protein H310_15415 [Aphanomyces invadans]